MARYRSNPVHPLIQRIWDEHGYAGPKDVSIATGNDINHINKLANVEPTEAFIDRIIQRAELLGLPPSEFCEYLRCYLADRDRQSKMIS